MKKLKLVFAMMFFAAIINAQKVNDKMQIESSGVWYPATILKVNSAEQTYFIHYDGWADSWDEWVSKDRMKDFVKEAKPSPDETKTKAPLTKFKVGDKVEVEYGMVPEPATVIEVGENKYHIQYDKKMFGDKWVTERQIKKL